MPLGPRGEGRGDGPVVLGIRPGWLRMGEVVFWDAILLVVVFLVWLRWF